MLVNSHTCNNLTIAVTAGVLAGEQRRRLLLLFVGCLTSQQHAIASQGQICSDNGTYCHTDIEVADQTFYLTKSQYTDIGLTNPSADPIMPGTWQGSHQLVTLLIPSSVDCFCCLEKILFILCFV